MDTLTAAYNAAGRRPEALSLLEEALRLEQARLGSDHPQTLTTVNNLAAVYQDANRLDRALPLFEEVHRLNKAHRGLDHPETIRSMISLADGYRTAGRLSEAVALSEEAYGLAKARLGPDHPYTLSIMHLLASAYWSARRVDLSVPLGTEVLKRREQKLGRNHHDTLMSVAGLGVIYRDAGRLTEDLPLLEEAYRASRTDPNLGWVGAELVDGYARAGRSAQAIALIREILSDARKSLPNDSPELAGMLARFGWNLLGLKAFAEAEPLLRECLAIREKAEPDAWSTFNARSLLGGALLGQKKYAEAEPLLRQGYEGMKAREKSIPPIWATRLLEALDRLIELSTATNRPEEVKKWQAERARYDKGAGSKPDGKK